MKRALIIGGIVLLLAGGVVTWNANKAVDEEKQARVEQSAKPIASADLAKAETVSSGTFIELDAVHRGSGTARVIKTGDRAVLELGDDFTVNNGPDLFVYMSPNSNAAKENNLGDFVSLGPIKAETGKQTYQLPDDYERFKSVVIWCRAFTIPFTGANLDSA